MVDDFSIARAAPAAASVAERVKAALRSGPGSGCGGVRHACIVDVHAFSRHVSLAYPATASRDDSSPEHKRRPRHDSTRAAGGSGSARVEAKRQVVSVNTNLGSSMGEPLVHAPRNIARASTARGCKALAQPASTMKGYLPGD